jgi:hypothetical protein
VVKPYNHFQFLIFHCLVFYHLSDQVKQKKRAADAD